MKKRTAVIFTAAVLASLAVGCSKNTETKDPTAATEQSTEKAVESTVETTGQGSTEENEKNLTVFWWGNQTRNERTQKILDLYAEENPGVTFDGQFADGSDYWTRLATLSAGHTMPDVIQMDYSYIRQYAENGLLVDLTPYIEDGTIDVSNVSDTILETGRVGEGIYGICNGINAPTMLYNKTLLDEAGLEIHDNMTLDEFVALCKEVYEKTGYKTSLTYGSGTSPDYLAYLLRAHDKQLYGDGAFAVDGPEAFEEFFSLFENGVKEGWHIDPSVYVERQNASVEQDCLVYGSSPETMSWCAFYHSNQLTAMQNAAPEGTEIGVTTWPSANPAVSDYLRPSQFFCVTSDSKNPETGASLINYITNSVECNNVLLGERGVPISSVVAKDISVNQTAQEQEVVRFINEVVTPNCTTINPPAPASGSEVNDQIKTLTEQVLYGEITAKQAAQQLYEKGNAILSAK